MRLASGSVCVTLAICFALCAEGAAAAGTTSLRGAASVGSTDKSVLATLPAVETTLGPVVGSIVSTSAGHAAEWLGIPYAASTGTQRSVGRLLGAA